jgi:hypothetical protein
MVANVGVGTRTARHGRPAQGRRRLLAGGALGGAGLVAACGAPAAPATSATADLRGTTVEYWGMWAPTHSEEVARLKVLQSFSAQNTLGVTVNAASASGQTVANMDKINGAVAAGTPPDMTNAQSSNMALLFATGATVDVDTELKGSADWKRIRPAIYPAILENHSWKGKVFGVPSHNSSQLMYFNVVALRRAGLAPPPAGWTWDAFFDYARKAAQPPEVTAYDDEWTYTGAGMWVLNNGGRFLSPDGTRVSLTGPEAAEAVEFLERLLRAGLMRPHDGSASGGYKELLPQQQVVIRHLRWSFRNDAPLPEALQRRATASYYALVTFLDAQIGRLLGFLDRSGLAGRTAVLYTSDHGELGGQHGIWQKQCFYEASVRVPLLLAPAAAAGRPPPPPGRVAENASLVDVFPALLDLAGLPRERWPAGLPGRSLLQVAAQGGERPTRAVFSEYHAQGMLTGGFMLKRGGLKYCAYVGHRPQLFDLRRDPLERHDLAADPRNAPLLEALDGELLRVADPVAVDARARADQARRREQADRAPVLPPAEPRPAPGGGPWRA